MRINHRHLRNPVRPIARSKFLPPPPEFASCPLEREAWPQNSESPFQLPLGPANILKEHLVHEPLDPRFRAAARLLQSLWREDRGLPIGSYVNEDGKRRKLGSRKLSEAAGKAGANFLTPKIAHIARRETAYREIGGLTDFEC
jgi:hypothetical protein